MDWAKWFQNAGEGERGVMSSPKKMVMYCKSDRS